MTPARRALVKRSEAKRRAKRRLAAAEKVVVLTAQGKWQAEDVRLKAWRKSVEVAPSMQPQSWRDGQLRYIDKLIAAHQANKPQGA